MIVEYMWHVDEIFNLRRYSIFVGGRFIVTGGFSFNKIIRPGLTVSLSLQY